MSRVQLQDSKKYGTDTRLECARKYILLGKSDRAIHLLLESDTESSSFYSDSLRYIYTPAQLECSVRQDFSVSLCFIIFQSVSSGHRSIIRHVSKYCQISGH